MAVIRQFLFHVIWGALDFLFIDLPPGTGDEPLSIMQLLPDLDGAGGEVDDEVIEFAPVDFGKEFTDDAHFQRTTPDNRSVGGLKEEFHGDRENVKGAEDRL